MVGVPGRSKACHNCRQRKIRCTGELPACQNCAKSNRVCTGYRRQHAFILSEAMVADGPTPSHLDHEMGTGPVMVSRWRADQDKLFIPPSGHGSLDPEMPSTDMVLLQPVSARNVFRDRLLSLAAENGFPGGNSAHLALGVRQDWLLHVLHLPSLTPALENSLLAVCTARLGRYAARPELVQESLKLYTKGISQTRRDILDKSMQKNEQSLAACLSLLWYEIMECPGGTMDGYRAHYLGCLELLQIRGAGAHTSGLAHATLQILRLHSVALGNQHPRKTFLAQPEWRDIPWSSQADAKSPFDRLVDLMLDMPDYFAQAQALGSVTDLQQVLGNAFEVIREGRRMQDALEKWFETFQAALPGGPYRVELSKVDSVVDAHKSGKLFPVAFHFPAFIVGRTLVYYWVALMSAQTPMYFTYRLLTRFMTTLDSIGRDNLPCTCRDMTEGPARCLQHVTADRLPGFDGGNTWPCAPAYNICQSVEYFLQEKMRGFGPASVLPALMWVKGFWKQEPGCWGREIAWIDDMVSLICASGHNIAGAALD